MYRKGEFLTGFTLVELVIVIVLAGIIIGFAMPGFLGARNKALDKQAQANLKLIQAAQKVYEIETNAYVNCSGGLEGSDQETCINMNLRLSLTPDGNNPDWDYETFASGCAYCQKRGGITFWRICIDDSDPSSGTCAGCP